MCIITYACELENQKNYEIEIDASPDFMNGLALSSHNGYTSNFVEPRCLLVYHIFLRNLDYTTNFFKKQVDFYFI